MALAMLTMSVSCAEEPIVEPEVVIPQTKAQSLTAFVPSAQTRISYTENDAQGIDLAWQENDTFSVYEKDGAWVADFKLTDLENSTFTSTVDADNNESAALVEGTEYVAVYPRRPKNGNATYDTYADYVKNNFAQTQDANNESQFQQLNSACKMECNFTYNETTAIKFAHTRAIMTIKFKDIPVGSTPTKVGFNDGSKSYVGLFLSNMAVSTAETDTYTVHMNILAAEASTRDLKFTVSYNDGTLEKDEVNTYIKESENPFNAGYRYIADLTTLQTGDNDIESTVTEIGTADDLVAYLNNVNAKDAKLTADIDLAGETITMGTKYLDKVFDGNGKTISNLTITTELTSGTGLFAGLKGTIKNLTVENATVVGSQYVGVLVGKVMAGAVIENCHVVNSSVEATITGKASYAGGLFGQCSADITSCSFDGTVTATNTCVGGITGACNAAINIVGCVNKGALVGTAKVGGITGTLGAGGNVVACYNLGKIGSDITTGSAAGIIGEGKATTNVIGCYNYSDFGKQPNGGNIGQITGYIKAADAVVTVTECYYVNLASGKSATGTACADITELNSKVADMNTAIASYTSLTFVDGGDATPTLTNE